jgi:hypothetical protein
MHDEVPRGLFRTNHENPFMSAAIDEMNYSISTIKHRAPLVMGVFHYGLFPLTKLDKRRKDTAG